MMCHDCKKEIKVKDEDLVNAKELVYDNAGEKITILKCDECYEKDPSLRNFQSCEVYSRCVGYYRPVQQWNKGKQQEYKERVNYETT